MKDAQPAAALKSFLASYPGRVLVAADTAGRREALLEVLQAADLRPVVLPDFRAFLENRHPRESGDDGAGFAVAVAPLDDGFALDAEAAGGDRKSTRMNTSH